MDGMTGYSGGHAARRYGISLRRWMAILAAMACGIVLTVGTAWAHDEGPGEPVDPSTYAAAGKLVVAFAAVVLVGGIWYQLRRRAIIRESRASSQQDQRLDRS